MVTYEGELVDFKGGFYPEGDFTAVLMKREIKKIGAKETEALVLTFKNHDEEKGAFIVDTDDDQIELAIFGLNLLKEQGRISDSTGLGMYIKSLRANQIKPELKANTFITTPSDIGKVHFMKAHADEKKVSAEGERVFLKWTVESIKDGKSGGSNNPVAQGTATQAPKANPDEMQDKWMEFLATNLTEPSNEAGIIKLVNSKIPNAAERKPYSDTRKATLPELVKQGFLKLADGKYAVA